MMILSSSKWTNQTNKTNSSHHHMEDELMFIMQNWVSFELSSANNNNNNKVNVNVDPGIQNKIPTKWKV